MNLLTKKSLALAASLLFAATAQAAVGDTLTYTFDTQSQGNALPVFPQATLLLTETTSGVDLTLTPNWAGGGNSVQQLLFVYSGDAFTFVDGAGPTPLVALETNLSIDSGYFASPYVIRAEWHPDGEWFRPSDASSTSWSMNGANITLADFMLSAITNQSKPSPSFGVISMPGTNTPGTTGESGSNWVAGSPGELVPAIPEPSTYALMIAGLGVVGMVARRRQRRDA